MAEIKSEETSEKKSLNFIEQIVENDLKEGKNDGKVQTRFPPEPNGYLHIGHAKAICLDFGIAAAHGGICNLRFDDTNPTKEDVEYVEAIKEDIQWLGYQWGNEYYASDYFQQLWDFAIRLIKEGKAYIDEQTSEQIAAQKGTPTQPGVESPYRNRPIEETLELFQKMNTGEIEEGAMVLRAKIDMASPNMHFRDPIIYRVVKHPHHRTGTTWKAYPMYDFAHGQSDYFEGVTHSLCTLEFVPHRPLYDLFVDWVKEGKDLNDHRPHQYEFNKLNLSYTLMSKRNLLTLVKEGLVNGWDDPRMPTICGFRRRGYSPESIHKFIDKIGYTTYDALNEFALLESAVREDLNARATRISAVLNPVKLIITNYPEGQVEEMEAINNPERPEEGSHNIEIALRRALGDPCNTGLFDLLLAGADVAVAVLDIVLRLRIGGDDALEVAQDDLARCLGDEVVGHDRGLAAAAGRVDHERGNAVAGGMAAQGLHDLDALGDRGAEVAQAEGRVAGIDVVRAHAHLDELVNQIHHDVAAVVHAGQQHGLVA